MEHHLTIVGGAVVSWPLVVRAQQLGKPTIGFLGTDAAAWRPWTDAFVERLRALGWIEGRTVAIEYRWAEGRGERFAEIAAEFVRLNVDVIVTAGTDAVIAAKKATSVIPVASSSLNDSSLPFSAACAVLIPHAVRWMTVERQRP